MWKTNSSRQWKKKNTKDSATNPKDQNSPSKIKVFTIDINLNHYCYFW